MEPDKAWNVTFPTVDITVLVRFYAGLMVHTPTVFHISLCTRPPHIPHVSVQLVFDCSSPVKPIYPLCVAVDLLHSRVFLSTLSTLIPLDPSNPLVGDISQERWMVSIVMWIPQSLDG